MSIRLLVQGLPRPFLSFRSGICNPWSNIGCKGSCVNARASTLYSRQLSTTPVPKQLNKPPLHFHVPLFPGVQLLDVAGPLDVLNIRSQYPETSGITLTLLSSTLDSVSTKPVPPPSAKWNFNLPPGTNTSFNPKVVPDVTFQDYLSAVAQGQIADDGSGPLKPIDVLLIPGGPGTRLARIHPESESISNTQETIEFVKAVASHVRHSVITICTGSHVLAQTGLLNGIDATTNSARFKDVSTANHPHSRKIKWRENKRWVRSSVPTNTSAQLNTTHDGLRPGLDVWSSAGITAGMDLMLEFVKAHYGGVKVAEETAKRLEYRWEQTDKNFA
jgi:putative intracellular protease/amidase